MPMTRDQKGAKTLFKYMKIRWQLYNSQVLLLSKFMRMKARKLKMLKKLRTPDKCDMKLCSKVIQSERKTLDL